MNEPDGEAGELSNALERCRRLAMGDSNDMEIEALQDALDLALRRWPDVREPRIEAHFTPEAWMGDQTIEVPPQGGQTWDATDYARECAPYVAALPGRTGIAWIDDEGVTDVEDLFKEDPDAPQWIRDWDGPFTIRLRRRWV